MANMWRRLWAAFAMELRLHCFHWTFPALHVAWSLLIWVMFRHSQDLGTARNMLETMLGRLSLGMVSLIALFVAGAAASRSERVRFTGLEQSLPIGVEVILGRWLATLVAVMSAMIQPLVYAWILGPAASWWEGAPIYTGEALLILGFVTAFAWWLVSLVGMRRWLYPVMAGSWLALLIVPTIWTRDGGKPAAVRLLDIMRLGYSWYVEVWGRMLEGRRPLWFDIFYLGLALLFVALIAVRIQRVRLRRRPVASAVLVAAALATAIFGGTRFVADYATWGAIADADNRMAAETNRIHQALVVDRSEVTADFRTPADPHYTARLVVRNVSQAPAATFDLMLQRQLKVTTASLPYDRNGEFLTLKPAQPLAPGASMTVDIAYGGPVFMLRRDPGSTAPIPMYFTTDGGIRLSNEAGWYPQTWQQRFTTHADLDVPAASVRLELRTPPDWGVVTNLPNVGPGVYEARKATWVAVEAGPRLVVQQSGNLTLAAARNEIAALEPVTRDYPAALAYLTRFFPAAKPTGITVAALSDPWGFPGDVSADGQISAWVSGFEVTGAAKYPENSYFYIGRRMLAPLWVMSGSKSPDSPVIERINEFLWQHYKFQGNTGRLGGGYVGPILKDVLQTKSEAGVARLIREVQAHPETQSMTDQQVEAWLKEAAGREK